MRTLDSAMELWAAQLLASPAAYWACLMRGVSREDSADRLDAYACALDAFVRQFPDLSPFEETLPHD